MKFFKLLLRLFFGFTYPAPNKIGGAIWVSSRVYLNRVLTSRHFSLYVSLRNIAQHDVNLPLMFLLVSLVFIITFDFCYFGAPCDYFTVLSAPFMLYNDRYKNIYRNLILIAPVMLFASISIYSPTFMFFFLILFFSLVCFLNFSYYIQKYLSQYNAYVIFILNLAYTHGILHFLGRLHIFIFYSGDKNFYIRAFIIHLMSFFYILLTRYYYYNFVFLKNSPLIGFNYFLFLVFSFICLVAVYIRFLVTLSIICISKIEILLPHLLPNILQVEEAPTEAPSSVPTTPKSFIHVSFHQNNNNHHHHYPKPRMSSWGKFGIGIGVCTLCVGSYTAYNSYLAVQAAQIQAQASQIQAQASISQLLELQRQNDLQERAQGVMSDEEYNKKWKTK